MGKGQGKMQDVVHTLRSDYEVLADRAKSPMPGVPCDLHFECLEGGFRWWSDSSARILGLMTEASLEQMPSR